MKLQVSDSLAVSSSTLVVLQNKKHGKDLDLMKFDWKTATSSSRQLCGHDEFAGFVCSLAERNKTHRSVKVSYATV